MRLPYEDGWLWLFLHLHFHRFLLLLPLDFQHYFLLVLQTVNVIVEVFLFPNDCHLV
jgi:hypothetical protein